MMNLKGNEYKSYPSWHWGMDDNENCHINFLVSPIVFGLPFSPSPRHDLVLLAVATRGEPEREEEEIEIMIVKALDIILVKAAPEFHDQGTFSRARTDHQRLRFGRATASLPLRSFVN